MFLGLSFYARKSIGAKLWRKLHRATVAVWGLGVIHTLGAGTDASTTWLRAIMVVTGVPIVFLFLRRVLPAPAPAPSRPAAGARPRAEPALASADAQR